MIPKKEFVKENKHKKARDEVEAKRLSDIQSSNKQVAVLTRKLVGKTIFPSNRKRYPDFKNR